MKLGCQYCAGNYFSLEEFKEICINKNLTLMSDTYVGNKIKLKFKCNKHDVVFEIIPYSIKINKTGCKICSEEKKIATNLKNNGYKYPTQNKEIRMKCAISANRTTKIIHWKTHKEIDMLGWESNVAEYFNENKINYFYEPKTFIMPDGKTYTPDFYLPKQDLWIEVKGRFYEQESKDKWNWFHKTHPNSELWMKKELKEKGIKTYRSKKK